MADPIRLLVVDDHPVVRDGLVAMLATQPDMVLSGEAGTGAQALELAAALQPDVILLDLEMPGMDGVAVLRHLPGVAPDARAVVLTAYDTDERIVSAVQAGARGYLLKGAPREEIFRAIRIVHGGASLLQPIVASKLLRQVSEGIEPLTPRELEVLALLARGATNREIATDLVITERTAKFHVSSILGKLGADNRTEAVALAAQRGLIDL
ncbi:MAG TPA: response regulator transcription factor [Anaerolineae bacterium]|nr:response regulator transcription factor [Anaerolineae bacterium]